MLSCTPLFDLRKKPINVANVRLFGGVSFSAARSDRSQQNSFFQIALLCGLFSFICLMQSLWQVYLCHRKKRFCVAFFVFACCSLCVVFQFIFIAFNLLKRFPCGFLPNLFSLRGSFASLQVCQNRDSTNCSATICNWTVFQKGDLPKCLSLWSDIPNSIRSSLWTLVSNETPEILGLSRMESSSCVARRLLGSNLRSKRDLLATKSHRH